MRRRSYVALLAAAVLVAVASSGSAGLAATAATTTGPPACFGAAAFDTVKPCSNPTLSVFPTAEEVDADYFGGSPCDPVAGDPAPICAFGVSQRKAKRHFALLGDSHALHWRRAIDVVALAERWRGYSITTAACPFSAAVKQLPQGLRPLCEEWYRLAMLWFKDHPEVDTVFTSSFAPLPVEVNGVPSGGGKGVVDVKIAGYRRTWASLPKTVKHVIHIRDNPLTFQATFDCVQRVIAEGTQPAGPACAMLRNGSLRYDTAVSTARLLHSPRYQYVDLSKFFCDATLCYPVIGGARVFKDAFGHLTTAYSRTLGPYLHREVRWLMKSWQRPPGARLQLLRGARRHAVEHPRAEPGHRDEDRERHEHERGRAERLAEGHRAGQQVP